jgi:predicted transcriptional regulator
MKSRLHLRLDDDLNERLDHLAAKPGASKSAIMADALRSYLNRKAGNEIDDLLKRRLDRISSSVARVERDVQIVMESQALFIHYQFQVTAPLADGDQAAKAVAQERFQKFIEQVGRRIAGQKDSDAHEALPAPTTTDGDNERSFH